MAGTSDAALDERLAARTEALCAVPSPIGHEVALCDEVERWARALPGASVKRIKNSLIVWVDPAETEGGTVVVRVDPRSQGSPPPQVEKAGEKEGHPLVVRVDPRSQGSPPPQVEKAGEREGHPLVVRVDPRSHGSPSPPQGERVGERGGRPLVALCGHLDTVPIHAADAGRPPRREGGRLVAPGSSDMKCGVAVAMELAERVPRADRFCDLALVLYAREEGPFEENELSDVLREAPEVRAASLALCLEPTDGVLQLGCVGSLHATFTFSGRSAHSARPWQGENAIHRAWGLLEHLAARPVREALSGGLAFREVLSATRIEGGRARNVVPERCALNLNFRFAPDKAMEAAAGELRALGERFGASVELTDLSPACPAFGDHPLVRRLAERSGAAVEPKQAWTDVARLAQAGVPAVNFGPGATAQAHQQGEWVELDAIGRCYRHLEAFLRV